MAEGEHDRDAEFLAALQPGLERACRLLRKRRVRLVGLQLPEGLRGRFRALARCIGDETGAAAALLSEPCWGACMAEQLPGIDVVLHVAHDRLLPRRPGVMYLPCHPPLDVSRAVEEALPLLEPPVGVLLTSTHAPALPAIKEQLSGAGLKVLTARGKRTGLEAVVLGCDLSAARALAGRVRSFLFVGSGAFHPVGVELGLGVKVISADPYERKARTHDEVRERMLRRRFAAVQLARPASRFGVLLGLFPGQERRKLALELKRLLERHGREAHLLAARRFSPEDCAHLGLEALVSTACPRIALDDDARYGMPVLTPFELEIVLGKREWGRYRLDELA